jgi:TfoX/Sxy family transcriptional regulator of competence genes
MPAKARTKTKAAAPKAVPAPLAKRPMPSFAPAPEWIKALFADLVSHFPEAEPRKMFGYPSAFVNGNMACGVFADRLMVRLSEADRAIFLQLPGAKSFEPMRGHPMKEYVEMSPGLLKAPAELRKWVKKGMAYTHTLPPKARKAK